MSRLFRQADLDQIAIEESTYLSEFLRESQYHTTDSGYFRTYYLIVMDLYDPVVYGANILAFKREFSIKKIALTILNSESGEYSFDIGKLYTFEDVLDVKEDDFLFHQEYRRGVSKFLGELKAVIDQERKAREDFKRKRDELIRKANEMSKKYSKVVTL